MALQYQRIEGAIMDIKYPATYTVHWPTGPVHACEKHARQLVGLSNFLGGHVATTIAPPDSACVNCENENKASDRNSTSTQRRINARLTRRKEINMETANKAQAVVGPQVICPTCDGEGGVDSGGVTPWGEPINLPCPSCGGKSHV